MANNTLSPHTFIAYAVCYYSNQRKVFQVKKKKKNHCKIRFHTCSSKLDKDSKNWSAFLTIKCVKNKQKKKLNFWTVNVFLNFCLCL